MPQGPNAPYTLLDENQIIQRVFDEAGDKLRVDAQVTVNAGTAEVIISQVDDSIRLGDGVNLITASIVGAKSGLDVNLIGGVVSGSFSSSGLSTGMKTTSMTITDTPTKVPLTPLAARNGISVRVWNLLDTTVIVYFGGSTMTAANGYPKSHGEEMQMDVKDNAAVELYAVCDTGKSAIVKILEVA